MCTPSLLLLFKLALQSRVIPPHSRCDSRSHTLWGNPREETTECLSSTFSAFKYHFSPDSPSNLVWVQWMPLSPSTRSCSWSEWADVVTCQAYIGTFEKNYWHHGPEGESDNVCAIPYPQTTGHAPDLFSSDVGSLHELSAWTQLYCNVSAEQV